MANIIIDNQNAGANLPDLFLATVDNYNYTTGTTLILPGSNTPTEKRYKKISSISSLANGQRVLVAKVSGTYLILGRIQ